MLFFGKNKKNKRVQEAEKEGLGDFLVDFLSLAGVLKVNLNEDTITREIAMNIPAVKACVELISNTVASLPINLYKVVDGKKEEVEDDRVRLLNTDTGDTLTGYEFKKAIVMDYLLEGNGYAYINKERNKVKSLHYVEESRVSVLEGIDPIFKTYELSVDGRTYRPFDFIKVLNDTRNGADGKGIIEQNKWILAVAYNSLIYENILSKTGGNKKGFIESERKLSQEAIDELKEQWRSMYSGNTEACVVLNNGLKFRESSATPTEMQINENKIANAGEICKIFNIPEAMLTGDGKENNTVYDTYIKTAILPVLKNFESALNKDLLLEKEKGELFFEFDTKELLKGDIEKRYRAYEIGLKNGFLKVNEVRYEENKEAIKELDNIVKLGLQDVLFDTKKGTIYTPNTDKETNINNNKNKIDLVKEA